MIYLRSFHLPSADREFQSVRDEGKIDCPGFPYTFFSLRDLTDVQFSRITLLCGGNGSGKTTLLNMIAEKIGLPNESAHYVTDVFHKFVKTLTRATYGEDDLGVTLSIPQGSRMIKGEDIVSLMLADRKRNVHLIQAREKAKEDHKDLLSRKNPFASLEDYDALCEYLTARDETHSQYATRTVGDFTPIRSNGETAIEALRRSIQPGKLYLLDEPENSLAPRFQAMLAQVILESAKYLDCQFIIATHSPFLAAMPGVTIYDLDEKPIVQKPWYELEAMRHWYALFASHKEQFEGM